MKTKLICIELQHVYLLLSRPQKGEIARKKQEECMGKRLAIKKKAICNA